MAQIGSFTLAKDGGWIGSIRTLTIDAKVHLVPNDNRENENAPAFRVFVGQSRIGDAWEAQWAVSLRRQTAFRAEVWSLVRGRETAPLRAAKLFPLRSDRHCSSGHRPD